MRVIRCFYPHPLENESELLLEGEAFHHAIHVLRCKKGSHLELFDGLGMQAQAEIIELNRRSARMKLQDVIQLTRESPLTTVLVQAISKGERMDYCVQKATELGVSSILPVISERCNVQMDEERWNKRLSHWNKIMISACEQCGRNSLPQIAPPVSLNACLANISNREILYVLHPKNSLSFKQILPNNQTIGFIVGPEGGFSDLEMEMMRSMDIKSVGLGGRILRTETCGIVALSIAQSRWGDLT